MSERDRLDPIGRHGGLPDPAPPRRRTSSGMDPPFWTDYFLPERTWREGSSNSFKGEGFFGIETERVPMTHSTGCLSG